MYRPPSEGKRVESSVIIRAVGTKKRIAARNHRLMEDVPLWAAAAIQRGPRTVAMLKRSTSQNPIVRRSLDLGDGVSWVKRVPRGIEDNKSRPVRPSWDCAAKGTA